ncbi:4Fe-4S ferredoxin N-terminal domain-containing protein [Halapricum desulfuricans]|uniref:Fe-S-cluster-containing dehydrogenase component n=1 Tax=Halapricum desulfuricans TaxID=2841257 RepID=A0A897N889_9EURY|nr:4Fe-4S ferredoxin N-terminal domain-containing protein [Halapricum desulfuricans]QSG07395.1 Fe-S-cluster-containing dehydrogenase component [Halapricum desulfuricans]
MSDNYDLDDIEDRAEERLAHVEFDTELGKQMARDARRVSNGELSRAAFEEKYVDDVREEFGVDLRGDSQADTEPTPGVPPTESKASRRDMLKATGALATGAVAAGAGSSVAGDLVSGSTGGTAAAQSGGDVQMGMVVDTETCIKCLRCVQGCKEENNTPDGHFWQEVFRYRREDKEYEGAPNEENGCDPIQRPCMHCDDAPCIEVCPNNSRFKTENGRVLCDYDTCLGCAYCEVACPYHVNAFVHDGAPDYLGDPESNEDYEPILDDVTAEFEDEKYDDQGRWIAGTPPDGSCSKCTFCAHREFDDEQDGSTTACEDVCPVDAIQFGDLNDPESAPRQYLKQKVGELDDGEGDPKEYLEEYPDETFTLREDASDPNVIYVGDDPSDVEVEAVPGPTTKDDRGLEEVDRTLH